jgi:hypothetical protein
MASTTITTARYEELLAIEKRFKNLAYSEDLDELIEQNATEMPNGKKRSKKHFEYLKDNFEAMDLDWSEMNDQIANRLEELDEEWEEEQWDNVYKVVEGVEGIIDDEQKELFGTTETVKTTYYQTGGGGPESGFFVRTEVGKADRVYEVERSWDEPFAFTQIAGKLEYEPADEAEGKPARCRIVE